MTEKSCNCCGLVKPLGDFYKAARGLFGVRSMCRICEVAKNRNRVAEWRIANKERYHSHAKAWADKNPERYAQILRDNFQKNKAKKLEYSRKWSSENREQKNEVRKKWRDTPERRAKESAAASEWAKKNRARAAANHADRRTRKMVAVPSWADCKAIAEIYLDAHKKSAATGLKWHVDHIVPLRSKLVCGLHVQQNLQVVPAVVNQRKSNCVWPDMP